MDHHRQLTALDQRNCVLPVRNAKSSCCDLTEFLPAVYSHLLIKTQNGNENKNEKIASRSNVYLFLTHFFFVLPFLNLITAIMILYIIKPVCCSVTVAAIVVVTDIPDYSLLYMILSHIAHHDIKMQSQGLRWSGYCHCHCSVQYPLQFTYCP